MKIRQFIIPRLQRSLHKHFPGKEDGKQISLKKIMLRKQLCISYKGQHNLFERNFLIVQLLHTLHCMHCFEEYCRRGLIKKNNVDQCLGLINWLQYTRKSNSA